MLDFISDDFKDYANKALNTMLRTIYLGTGTGVIAACVFWLASVPAVPLLFVGAGAAAGFAE